MVMECLSIYSDLWFLSVIFCSLQKSCTPFVKFIPKRFILFDAIVGGTVSLLMNLGSALFSGMVGVGVYEVVHHQNILD